MIASKMRVVDLHLLVSTVIMLARAPTNKAPSKVKSVIGAVFVFNLTNLTNRVARFRGTVETKLDFSCERLQIL